MRIGVAGFGGISALPGSDAGFSAICAGASALVRSERWGVPVAEVAGVPTGKPRTLALAEAALADVAPPPAGLGIVLATSTGGMRESEPALVDYFEGRLPDPPQRMFGDQLVHHIANAIAASRHAKGPVITVSTACTSGTTAIGVAVDYLRAGVCRDVLVVGADALCQTTVFGFRSLGAVTPDRCRPFDQNRNGMALGEGAAWLWLREAQLLHDVIEVVGVGTASDGHHLTAPRADAWGLSQAFGRAARGLDPAAIDHVNAHATGTVANDGVEAEALARLAPAAAIAATKGATGHTLGAAGVLEAVYTLLAMERGIVPPVVGLEHPLAIDVSAQSRFRRIHVAASVNLAFGGHNAVVVFRRIEA